MAETPEKECILIAEDSPPNRKILSHLLEKLGYHVISCGDGKEAWEILKAGKVPNLVAVISDVMMPNMDGLQLLKNVRGAAEYEQIPFVLVTAVSDRDMIVEAKTQKVNGYILKPVTFQRVIQKLKELFPNKQFPAAAA